MWARSKVVPPGGRCLTGYLEGERPTTPRPIYTRAEFPTTYRAPLQVLSARMGSQNHLVMDQAEPQKKVPESVALKLEKKIEASKILLENDIKKKPLKKIVEESESEG